jgi:hypothetical protein
VVIVKLRTTGALATGKPIGGVNAIVSAPPVGLAIADGDHAATGAGVGSLLVASSAGVAADVLGMVNASGIELGEFATLTYHVADGAFPAPADFGVALTGPGVIDTDGVTIPGAGVALASVTLH